MTQVDLARLCRCAPNTIGRIERGQLQPSGDLSTRLAGALDVSLDELQRATVESATPATSIPNLRNVLHFLVDRMSEDEVADFGPVVDEWVSRARTPRRRAAPPSPLAAVPSSFDIVDVEQLPHRWVGSYLPIIGRLAAGQGFDTTEAEEYPAGLAYRYLRLAGAPANAFALTVQGHSMAPEYQHGDMVIVDPGRVVDSGICVAVTDDGAGHRVARLKRLLIDGEDARLESLNSDYPAVTVPARTLQAFGVWRHLSLARPRDVGEPGYRW